MWTCIDFNTVFYIRFWLNMDVKVTDARLGWVQKTFHLTGDEVRQVIVIEPRVTMNGIGPLEVSTCDRDVTFEMFKFTSTF